jgi:hypothetical protein
MQDFLKDRPVLAPQDAKIIAPATPPAAAGGASPFARIVRDEAAIQATRPVAVAPSKVAVPANAAAVAAHTSQVKTVIENGRIARLIVTCSCGKVTEIACAY